jgi:CRP/FNR family transcriptional regulator, cyclic AMP receptor protein
MDERIDALKAVPIFEQLSNKDLRKVLEIAKVVVHEDGRPIMEEDASAAGFHLILDGEARVDVRGNQVAMFGPGDYFGEMSIIDGKPRSATVTAVGTLRTLGIPAWTFERLMTQHPTIMRALLVQLSSRIRAVEAVKS